MFFSIITVTYNAQQNITETLKSVADQTCKDYELLVIDGDSTDETINLVRNFEKKIQDIKIIVEPDRGIYDAMNKGVKLATGNFIYFLNAGDVFYNSYVLENTKSYIENDIDTYQKKQKKIYFGNIIRDGKERSFSQKFSEWKWVYMERADFSHQSLFSTRDLLEEFPFDTSFRICADRDWFIKSMKSGAKYIQMKGLIIAKYEGGGASAGYKNQQAESLILSGKYGGKKAVYFVKLKRRIGTMLGHKR